MSELSMKSPYRIPGRGPKAVISATVLALLLSGVSAVRAGVVVRPQAGLEVYTGANRLSLITPWVGVRFGLSNTTSVIAKFYNHNLSYQYDVFDEASETFITKKRTASLMNFTGVVYHQNDGTTAWAALSRFSGTDGYRALALDAGVGRRVLPWLTLEGGVYLLREDSVLWYPDEAVRKINLYSLKGALKIRLTAWAAFNPNLYVYKNSDGVDALSFSAGFIFTPKDPWAITVYYFRYSESSQYKFAGDYLSAGINLYY